MELRCRLKFASDKTIDMYYVNSSNVASVGYDPEEELLFIEFLDGSLYKYENVDQGMWNSLQSVDSKGSWVHWYLKINDDSYPYENVTGDYDIEYVGVTPNPGVEHPEGYLTGF